MKAFSLQEYLENPQRKIVTRNGGKIRIICTDKKSTCYPIVALLEYSDENTTNKEAVIFYNEKGKIDLYNNNVDLFFAPEKKEGWITVCKDGDDYYTGGTEIYSSEFEAVSHFRKKFDSIKTVKIEWEE